MNLFKRKKNVLELATEAMDQAIDRTKSNFREIIKNHTEGTEQSDELSTMALEFAAYKAAVSMVLEETMLPTAVNALAESIFKMCASQIMEMENSDLAVSQKKPPDILVNVDFPDGIELVSVEDIDLSKQRPETFTG
jgi:hypothetical protein